MATIEMPESRYPNNSNKKKEENKREEKKIERVVHGEVIKRKKSFGRKFTEAFLGDDSEQTNIKDYILYDVLIPAAKNTISEMVTGGIDMLLFGERRSSRQTTRDRGKSYVSYSNYYKREEERNRRHRETRPIRNKIYNDDIVLPTRGDAEEVIDRMMDLIDEYGSATVADLYELVGIDSEYTDNKYGWTNLNSARAVRVRDGYLLELPVTRVVD